MTAVAPGAACRVRAGAARDAETSPVAGVTVLSADSHRLGLRVDRLADLFGDPRGEVSPCLADDLPGGPEFHRES